MSWTLFWDMHSSGRAKVQVNKESKKKIYIEAPKGEAEDIFRWRFSRDPYHITCGCCGYDYSVYEGKSLADLSAFHRHCDYVKGKYVERGERYVSLDDYVKQADVLVIYKERE